MAVRLVTSGDLLCAAGSSLQGSRREFAALVSGVRVTICGGGSRSCQRPGLVYMAVSKQQQQKQKKKGNKEKRKAGGAGRGKSHGWNFDALMLVWDEVFDRCCADGGRAGAIRALGNKGLERFGSGCVLVQETVRTLPRGSASGFSSHARHSSSKDIDEPPAYETLTWTAQYVPRTFVLNPSLAPEEAAAADLNAASVVYVTDQVVQDVPLVTREVLFSVLRGMDRTRIMGLTGDNLSSVPMENGATEPMAADAGGEEPYNPRDEEIVLMLVVMVDGQPAVGADVVKARPTVEHDQELWKLEMRDFHSLPIPV